MKITPASKHKAGGISRKSSTEEKERGRDKEREKEESNDKEEKKEEDTSEESRAEEQAFLVELYKYMKDRDTPIERIPFLGFKQSEYHLHPTLSHPPHGEHRRAKAPLCASARSFSPAFILKGPLCCYMRLVDERLFINKSSDAPRLLIFGR